MDYDINGVNGDWGPQWSPSSWFDQTGTTANNGPQVQANSVLAQSSVTEGQDRWSGVFANLIGSVTQYAIAKDAAASGMRPAYAANGQPIYTANGMPAYAPATGGMGNVLLIGALIVGAVLIAKNAG